MNSSAHEKSDGLDPRLALGLAAMLISAAAGVTVAACGNACAELQTICGRCLDPNQKLSCERTVGADDSAECDLGIESFADICE